MTNKKPKIEAIYPLSTMQQGLLFHHLMEGDDEGFLIVQCNIEGKLNVPIFKKAWEAAVNRHEIMRTSVHWKKVKQPVLLVQPNKDIEWSFIDWKQKSIEQQSIDFENYKKERKKIGATLDKNPLSKITVIEKTENSYYFLWECHHLLLDGWSSTIILRDAFSYYKDLLSNSTTELQTIPSYKSYNSWLNSTPKEEASLFWKKTFSNFTSAALFKEDNNSNTIDAFSYKYKFSKKTSDDLKELAKSFRFTLNTLFQGIWSIALSKYFNRNDVTFGNTVSGRSNGFPNIDLMAGMFANVLPVRANIENTELFKEYFKQLQTQQQEARNYEYCTTDQISKWADTPKDKPLFDSLFVFENFPWEDIIAGDVTVTEFESGITTTYPITTIFKIEDTIEYNLLVNKNIVPDAIANWFLNSIPAICNILLNNPASTIKEIIDSVIDIPVTKTKNITDKIDLNKKEINYVAPRNQVELTLVEIWEQLFNINYISITDSFFLLGGKSLLSVKMFALIKEKLDVTLPPTTLLESPTIKDLSKVILNKSDKNTIEWKYLVPIKTKGTKTPLFCIHAGGGHVFFYKSLADALEVERPVYALQPVGIFGEDNKHKSIEDMAKDYADEIRVLQPKGTLNIIVYCFSTAVGLEMASYLKTVGRDTHLIVADTIAEHRLLNKERFFIRTSAFFKRFLSNPFKALNEMVGYRILFYIKPIRIQLLGNDAEKNTENMRQHLVQLFNAYSWSKKTNNVSLILTEKLDKRYNEEIIRSWEPLINGDVAVETTNGKHSTFFENPDVIVTAKTIDKIIED